jgi:hypothetical protein
MVCCGCVQTNKITLHRDHKWDIFGMWLEDPEVTQSYGAAKDVFFSEISQVLSRGVRHVITPPSASWYHFVSITGLTGLACSAVSFVGYIMCPAAGFRINAGV